MNAWETACNLARAPRMAWRMSRGENSSEAERRKVALRRAKHLVEHAARNVPFYHDLYKRHGFSPHDLDGGEAAWQRVPKVTKEDLIAAGPTAIDGRLAKERLMPSVSSGTTGRILTLYHDPRRLVHHGLATVRMLEPWGGYKPWHRQAYLYTAPYPVTSVLGLYPLDFIPTLSQPKEALARLAARPPHILAAYPSHLQELLAVGEDDLLRRATARLRVITTNSEQSTRSERDAFAQRFSVPVFDEYSTEELGRVAAECPMRRYHVYSDLVLLEHEGGLVGTNLNEWALPIIRYEQGDEGRILPPGCECGASWPILADLHGRKAEHFVFADGTSLTPGFLLDACYAVVLAGVPVATYQMVHEGGDRVSFWMVLRPGANARAAIDKARQLLLAAFASRGVRPDLEVQVVEDVPHRPRGAKRRLLVVKP